jgi:hypothetical protein
MKISKIKKYIRNHQLISSLFCFCGGHSFEARSVVRTNFSDYVKLYCLFCNEKKNSYLMEEIPPDPRWRLWLDDQADQGLIERDPPITMFSNWKIAKSSEEAINLVKNFGIPRFMDLDFDLGENDTALNFLKWLYEYDELCIRDIKYNIHSQNIIGRENMRSYISSWKRSLLCEIERFSGRHPDSEIETHDKPE